MQRFREVLLQSISLFTELHLAPPPQTSGQGRQTGGSISRLFFDHLSTLHTPLFTPKGAGRRKQEESFPTWKGRRANTAPTVLPSSSLMLKCCPLSPPTCCLCGILAGQPEGSWSRGNTFVPALTVISKADCSETSGVARQERRC